VTDVLSPEVVKFRALSGPKSRKDPMSINVSKLRPAFTFNAREVLQRSEPEAPDVTPVIDKIVKHRGSGLATEYRVRWRTDEESLVEETWEPLDALTDAKTHIEEYARRISDMSHLGWPAIGSKVSALWKGNKKHPSGWFTATVMSHNPKRNNLSVRWDCDNLTTVVSQKDVRHADAMPVSKRNLSEPRWIPTPEHLGAALHLCSGTGGEARMLSAVYDPMITVDWDLHWSPMECMDVREFARQLP